MIGAVGALDDMTVTQASVVFELRRTDPTSTRRDLFTAAMRVGRDHVASTVNTLFLAYAGASLPLLLLFSVGRLGAVDVANSEVVATEIVRTLVGSIGLVASVPLTTWLAVRVVGNGDDAPVVPSGQRPPKRRASATLDRSGTKPANPEPANPEPANPASANPELTDTKPPPTPRQAGRQRWKDLRDGIDD